MSKLKLGWPGTYERSLLGYYISSRVSERVNEVNSMRRANETKKSLANHETELSKSTPFLEGSISPILMTNDRQLFGSYISARCGR